MTSVIIVGAGAAGLTAAYHLQKAGLDNVKILEASDRIGGRIRKDETLADFPIDLGAEWIHGNPENLLNPIVDSDIASEVKTVKHDFGQVSVWDGSEIYLENPDFGAGDHKWVDYTWFDFFNDHLVSTLNGDNTILNCAVISIDYSNDESNVACQNGGTYQADFVVVTASMKLLQNNQITFTPSLPSNYQTAIANFQMAPGIKVFMEFNTKFYPPALVLEQDWTEYSVNESSENYADRIFYDETFGNPTTTKHVMGMFAYGAVADQFVEAPNADVVVDTVLAQLDTMFAGQASTALLNSKVQIWPQEQYVQTAYTRWVTSSDSSITLMQTPLADKILFAGEALPIDKESWGYAHGAALSGKAAARKILQMTPNAPTLPPTLDPSDSPPSFFSAVGAAIASVGVCLFGWLV